MYIMLVTAPLDWAGALLVEEIANWLTAPKKYCAKAV
jgi:hypothetical protein